MQTPSSSVAVILTHEDKVLVGERIETNETCWQLPGGHIKLGETPLQAIKRETLEETNLNIQDAQLIALTNNIFCANSHSISLVFQAKCNHPTKLRLIEKAKCKQWYWAPWDKLPQPLFLPFKIVVDSGYHPFLSTKAIKTTNKQNNCFIF